MIEKIIIAGAGGQGVMLMGKVLAYAAMLKGLEVTWLPSYGAEVRGGTAHCTVIISDTRIGSPYVETADTLIIMNELSLVRFKPRLKNNGLLIVNGSLAYSVTGIKARVLKYPFTDIAIKLGNIKIANMIMLGCYVSQKKIITVDNILKSIEELAPADKKGLVQINKDAVSGGAGLEEAK